MKAEVNQFYKACPIELNVRYCKYCMIFEVEIFHTIKTMLHTFGVQPIHEHFSALMFLYNLIIRVNETVTRYPRYPLSSFREELVGVLTDIK